MRRKVFFISDGTGITAETLGHSLITQFEEIEFDTITIPYIDDKEKAQQAINQINLAHQQDKIKPLIFATLVNPEIHTMIAASAGELMDFFKTFIGPLERELGQKSSFTIGRSHAMVDFDTYKSRIDAINYTITHDDGSKPNNYSQADIILVGVSRSGKTPTSLYLALQFGTLAANYPFTDEDFNNHLALPVPLQPYKSKLFGLTINADRLSAIRRERLPNSKYASLQQCKKETKDIIALYERHRIPHINTTYLSIEEISTQILATSGIQRKTF